MVKAIVDDMKVEIKHRDLTMNTLAGPSAMVRTESEAILTITCRVNSRDKVQWEALQKLYGSGPMEVELSLIRPKHASEFSLLPRAEEEYPIGRRQELQGDVPEASQGKETW
jgi:hypothetical protein